MHALLPPPFLGFLLSTDTFQSNLHLPQLTTEEAEEVSEEGEGARLPQIAGENTADVLKIRDIIGTSVIIKS